MGHGARGAAELVSILREAHIQVLVDVRAYPTSKRHPQFSREALCAESEPADCHRSHIADWLAARGHRVVHLLAPGRAREHALHPQGALWRDV